MKRLIVLSLLLLFSASVVTPQSKRGRIPKLTPAIAQRLLAKSTNELSEDRWNMIRVADGLNSEVRNLRKTLEADSALVEFDRYYQPRLGAQADESEARALGWIENNLLRT